MPPAPDAAARPRPAPGATRIGATIRYTSGVTTKIGVSLPDSTYARAVDAAQASGTTVSGLVNEALLAELTRRAVAAHVAMLAEAENPDRLTERVTARSAALAAWKRGG